MKNVKWGEVITTLTMLLMGTFLLIRDHPVAGGWMVAMAVIGFTSNHFDHGSA